MKGTTCNSPLFLQVCSSNVFGNIALKTKTGHVPTCMVEFVEELSYTGILFFLQKKKKKKKICTFYRWRYIMKVVLILYLSPLLSKHFSFLK